MDSIKFSTVDEYISSFPEPTAKKLTQIREIVKKLAPGAKEIISYNMPAFKMRKILLYYAGHSHHIGFYALPKVYDEFKKEMSKYKTGKGSIQFPLNEELPMDLIKRIIEYKIPMVS